jgi:radical SAM enzyme (TIGR01210 family)
MCDLWKNTTDSPVPAGAIPEQIRYALARLPAADTIKLYNNGNFFDKGAIPPADYTAIAGLLQSCKTVVVENHPMLVDDSCLRFRDMLGPQLQVAIGLETIHPEVLPALNKQMTLKDFEQAVQFLTSNNIPVRTFILLRPPFMDEDEGVLWARKAIKFALDAGVAICTVIPTRKGNGAMDYLLEKDLFREPSIASLEEALEYGITLGTGHVFADLWDIRMFSRCETCFDNRVDRLNLMNTTQNIPEPVMCSACAGSK